MVIGIVIPAAGDRPLEVRECTGFEDYQSAVGGWFEPITLPELGVTMYVNEEGGIRQLPPNARASFLRWYFQPLTRASGMLAGDVVLVGKPNQADDDTDVPEDVRDRLLHRAPFGIEMRTDVEPQWHRSAAVLPDYWSALVWTLMLTERFTGLQDARIAPIEPTPPGAPTV